MSVELRQPFAGSYPITLDYGEKFPPLYTDESPHRGIDYGTPMRTEILAAADGIVWAVGNLTVGYGKYVVISHGNGVFRTLYAHLDEIHVKEKQEVKQGQVIGLSGTSGNSTGPHLHFELIKNGYKIDAKPYLNSVLDGQGYISTPEIKQREFEAVHAGFCKVVCDVANVRCHCDMTRVIGQMKYGDKIIVDDEIYMWNGLPYRNFYDAERACWLRIAEHDPETQMIENC